MNDLIEVIDIHKHYKRVHAVAGISFTVPHGKILGLLGRNGAGKSTTLNIITGCLYPDSGNVMIDGINLRKEPLNAKKSIGYLPETAPMYPELTVEEYLRFVLDLHGVRSKNHTINLDFITEMMDLSKVRNQIIATLSKGFRQRVGIAQAFCNNAKNIILDEPTIGLDPQQIVTVRRAIRSMKDDYTIVLSSHILSEVADICDQVVIIDSGKVLEKGSVNEIVGRHSFDKGLNLLVKGDPRAFEKSLIGVPGVKAVVSRENMEQEDTWVLVVTSTCDVREAVFRQAIASGTILLNMSRETVSLEDIFIQLTSDDHLSGKDKDTV